MDISVTSHRIEENKFKNRSGFYRYRVAEVLEAFGVDSITSLRDKAKEDGFLFHEIIRYRGMGTRTNPGQLLCEIFQIQSQVERKKEMILNSLGEGI